ncbi:MAG: FAD-dependent oxidoreductase [Actinomycetota bacterium]|nr:FAD-dependent oxidoreductase [Actinomycetota bacterium]
MNRSDASLWWSDRAEGPTSSTDGPTANTDVDAVVIGAGIAGLMIASELAASGRSVCIVEARSVAAGVTGSSTAKVSALHGATYHRLARRRGPDVAAVYARANQAGIEQYERLIREHGIDCGWSRLDAVTYTADAEQSDTIRAELEAASVAGLEVTSGIDVPVSFPVAAAVRCANQAMFDPVAFCAGLAAALRHDGVQILEGVRVRHVEPGPPHVAHTDLAPLRAPVLVLATQLPVYDPGLFFARCSPVRSYSLAATLREPVPELMSLSIDEPSRSMRPLAPGSDTGVFGGGSHRVGEGGDTRRFHASLEQWVREHFAVRSIDARWSAQDYEPTDGVPFIGRMPHAPDGVFVATAFKKWGFTTAAVAGRIVADLVDDRDNPWAATFDATRAAVDLEGAGELVQSNAKVAVHFVGDRLSTLRPKQVDALEPGDGAIVEVDGEKLAAHRDDAGALHLVSARCTHLGCLVAWNAAERSWDCPCHGSRFDCDGAVLTGPATLDLPRRSGTGD